MFIWLLSLLIFGVGWVGVITVAFKSREDHRKRLELEEARKAGLAPSEVDEDGKEINPHIPQYMSLAPWYLNADRQVYYILICCFLCLIMYLCIHGLSKQEIRLSDCVFFFLDFETSKKVEIRS